MNDILTTIVVIGAIIILLQVMIIISYWRRGTKYAAMEQIYRQRQAEVKARESRRAYHLLADWDVDEEKGPEEALDEDLKDPAASPVTLDESPRA